MPAVARWVAVPARPRRCVRAAAGQGRGRGGGGYRQRAGGSVLRDPYSVLGIPTDASQAEVKLAFRKLVRTYHPDVNPDENAAARFRRINAAYEIVGDVERRRRFDLGQDWEVRPRTVRPAGKTNHDPIHLLPRTQPLHPLRPHVAGHGRGMDARGGDKGASAGDGVRPERGAIPKGSAPTDAKGNRRRAERRRATKGGNKRGVQSEVQTVLGRVVPSVDGGVERGGSGGVGVLRGGGAHARTSAAVSMTLGAKRSGIFVSD